MRRNSTPRAAQVLDRPDDVARRDGDVLRAGALVELEVLVDLRLALALGRLVDRELHAAVAVGDDLATSARSTPSRCPRRRSGSSPSSRRRPRSTSTHSSMWPSSTLPTMWSIVSRPASGVVPSRGAKPGRKAPLVVAALDEACGACRRRSRSTRARPCRARRERSCGSSTPRRAALERRPVGVVDVRHRQRDDLHAVAVAVVVGGDLRVASQRAGEHERMRPCRSTWETRSRTPVSRPA